MSRDREPKVSLLLYHLFKWSVVSPSLHVLFRGRIFGAEQVPKRGGLVVVSNHASDFDPPLVASAVGRPVAFMAKEELFQIPVLREAIRLYGAYPVRRGAGDRQALKSAIQFLDQGWATGVFLQGTRTADGRITDPKLGAALIAAKRQVPLLPVCIWGTHGILPKGGKHLRLHPVTIRIGAPLPPPPEGDRLALESATQQCTETINTLHALGR